MRGFTSSPGSTIVRAVSAFAGVDVGRWENPFASGSRPRETGGRSRRQPTCHVDDHANVNPSRMGFLLSGFRAGLAVVGDRRQGGGERTGTGGQRRKYRQAGGEVSTRGRERLTGAAAPRTGSLKLKAHRAKARCALPLRESSKTLDKPYALDY